MLLYDIDYFALQSLKGQHKQEVLSDFLAPFYLKELCKIYSQNCPSLCTRKGRTSLSPLTVYRTLSSLNEQPSPETCEFLVMKHLSSFIFEIICHYYEIPFYTLHNALTKKSNYPGETELSFLAIIKM
jgi:hypothetical protein